MAFNPKNNKNRKTKSKWKISMDNVTRSSLLDITSALTTNADNIEKVYFSWYDYILFSTMLAISGVIGIYFGCFGKKQDTTKEYLMGGKRMRVIPVAISLVASHTSGITLLALPADVYVFGAAYWLGAISMIILAIITVYVYLPVFFNLHLTSTYEYLGRRFDERTRKCASFLFALALFVYLPIVIYIPALAFSADTLQFSVTVAAMTTIFFLGLKATGGIGNVWQTSLNSTRLDIFDTLSGNLNCLAGTIYEDFLKGRLEKKGRHRNAGYILKLLVVITGVISTLMVYVVENLGGLLSLSIGLGSVAHGPLLGMFTLGVLFPRANAKGAFYGAVISMFGMGTIITTTNYYKSRKILKYPTKPVSIDGRSASGSEVFSLFKISFYWYTLIGTTIGMTVGLIISYLTEENDPPVSMELLSPIIYPFLPKKNKNVELKYCTVEEALRKASAVECLDKDSTEDYLRKASYASDVIDD
ncbi:hypothetical protein NQ314_014244 [Rhamnusium bicolor]|uniref:Sodium-coupled monocarboxylate transporter 1 n=1 Tax=Rhamnusium bicolor TaxID=1586634 RepID=A0AAV8X398_9CUCU|nr:hypothetical protein NQ314_014244 [Rhamnusium bicolor]